MHKTLFLLVCASFLIISCAPTRFVQPLEKGQHSIGFDIGGPLIEFSGSTIPVPLSNINYGYGLNENLTLFGSLHSTSLAFGNIQTDIGATYKFWDQNKYIPNVSIMPALNFVTNINEGQPKLWPQLDINAYWQHGENNSYGYVGFSNWFELSSNAAHGEEVFDHWLFNPQIGYMYKTSSWAYNLELKFIALSHKSDFVFVPYKGLTGNNGATGLYFGISKRF